MNRTRNALRRALPLLPALLSATALAQQAPEPVERIARAFLEQQALGLPGEVAIEVGHLDPANQLPPCAELIPFLPSGTRAWGQLNVGVRCDSPVTWTAYLPARVAVTGDYLTVARPLRAGQVLGPADIARRRGDLTALPDNTLTDSTQAIGHSTRYAVAQGSALRGDMLRMPAAVRQGQNVQVISGGSGFKVSSEGRALNNAGAGEAVRVRMPNGQVVSGTAAADGTVSVGF